MSVQSWSPNDSIRHFMYESIYNTLSALPWENRPHAVLDFGSRWYGDADGGWQTHMRTMLKAILKPENVIHTLATYPDYNIEAMPQVKSNSWDFVIVDNTLEHVKMVWLAAEEIHRVCKLRGIAVVATPGAYPIHPSPKDYWRLMPDAYEYLFPSKKWETLLLDMWGSAERISYEYSVEGGAFPYGPPHRTPEQSMGTPGYVAGNDGRNFLQIWWVGRKR